MDKTRKTWLFGITGKMKIYDISMEINQSIVVWKNKDSKKPKFITTAVYSKDSVNESRINIDLHTGTHADAYYHMLAKGKKIDKLALDKFMGKCIVLDFIKTKKNQITLNNIKKNNNSKKIKKNDIVLLKTRSKPLKKFIKNFTYLEKSGAKYLANRKIKCLGIDAIGVERSQPKHETHKILFKKNTRKNNRYRYTTCWINTFIPTSSFIALIVCRQTS